MAVVSLRQLARAGVASSTLFPEVQGVCAELKLKYSDVMRAPVESDHPDAVLLPETELASRIEDENGS